MSAPEIAALDIALARAGEDIVLRRMSGSTPIDCPCRAVVRGVTQDSLIGTIKATDLEVIISPTPILAQGWPNNEQPQAGAADPRIPRINDFAVVKGKQRQVKFADPIYVGGQWVRCNIVVAG
ncbi:hypothetical protein M8R20_24785 [Pseudomonas sp. R2.Fl]|nr:hypothetical protein [Pseudomonas sp. R2.Fl]